MSAALPDVWYLSDPQDGASSQLLSELAVVLNRKDAHTPSGAEIFKHTQVLSAEQARESTADQDVVYTGSAGTIVVDVRDSADAWVRMLVQPGDSVRIGAQTRRRVFMSGADSSGAGNISFYLPRAPVVHDLDARQSTTHYKSHAVASADIALGTASFLSTSDSVTFTPRFKARGSAEEAASNAPHFSECRVSSA